MNKSASLVIGIAAQVPTALTLSRQAVAVAPQEPVLSGVDVGCDGCN